MEKEILYRFFEGKASVDEMRQVKVWMESCPENEGILLQERKLFDAMLLMKRGKEPQSIRPRRTWRITRELLKVAAVVLLTLTVKVAFERHTPAVGEPPVQVISVPPGQRVNLTLPDGTNVWLNARTTLTYPVDFNRDKRLLHLDGEAYFEVAPDSERPFIVATSKGRVEALGTDFNVEAYAVADEFETTLMNGKVRVSLSEGETESIILTPDKRACLRDGRLEVDHVADYTPYRWREGLICFKRASFASIMKEFEKYYGVTIEVHNQEVLQSFYTGKFRHTDGVDYALRVLQRDLSFTYVRDEEANRVVIVEEGVRSKE